MDEQKMKNFHRIWIGAIAVFGLGALFGAIYFGISKNSLKENGMTEKRNNGSSVSDSEEEENGNENIGVINIKQDMKIKSPLAISGEARGWYFEGVFPIMLVDENGKDLGRTNAEAQGDWMADDFVAFDAILTFEPGAAKRGKIIFEKSNPSGLPEKAKIFEIPVTF